MEVEFECDAKFQLKIKKELITLNWGITCASSGAWMSWGILGVDGVWTSESCDSRQTRASGLYSTL